VSGGTGRAAVALVNESMARRSRAALPEPRRKLAVVSNRNGFFYAIDRTNGQFVYAFPLVEGINWTSGLDPKTGRPKVNEALKPKVGGGMVKTIIPGLEGGTNWFPPAYDPDLGLFFVAVNQWGMGLTAWEKSKLLYKPGDFYQGADYQMYRMGETIGRIKAIDVANGVKYGLSASIFTQDVNRAFRAMQDIYTGILYSNAGTTGAEIHLPFGGTKATGNGHREAGTASLDFFTEWQSIYVDYSGKLQRAQIDNQ